MVLSADFPMAEILARTIRDYWNCRHSGAHCCACWSVFHLSIGVFSADRGGDRLLSVYSCSFSLCFVAMGLMSVRDDQRDPSIAKQVAKQREETEQFMREPFEPEPAIGSLAAANVALADPLAAAGKKVYEGESCDACHGENGVGTAAGPKLAGATAQKSAEELSNLLRHPTAKMIAGEMKPVDVSDEDLKALVAYIKSLK